MEQHRIKDIFRTAMEIGRQQIPFGEVATYIPELGTARKDALGLCLALPDGTVYKEGDTNIRFTIQSISKAISLCKALEVRGRRTGYPMLARSPPARHLILLWSWISSPTSPSTP